MELYKNLSQPIIDWVLKTPNWNYFEEPAHESGFVLGLKNLNQKSKELVNAGFPFDNLFKLEEAVISKYNLDFTSAERCPSLGIFLSYSEKGHVVHRHSDVPESWFVRKENGDINWEEAPIEDGTNTVRFNILLSKPIEGGDPVINDIEIPVEEYGVWVCWASKYVHTSTRVEGDKPRIMISFGFNLNDKQVDKLGLWD